MTDPAPEQLAPPGAYIARRTVYRLEPDPDTDPDLAADGLWFRVTSATLRQLLGYGYGTALQSSPEAVFREFAGALVEWNIHDEDGKPVPTTFDGLASLDERLVRRLIRMWQQVLTGVANPFADASSSGPPAPPMQIPMIPTAS